MAHAVESVQIFNSCSFLKQSNNRQFGLRPRTQWDPIPYIVHYFDQGLELVSKVVHFVENRVPFGTQFQSPLSSLLPLQINYQMAICFVEGKITADSITHPTVGYRTD